MARINSRSKGNKNERDVCKWFEEWTSYEFSRTPSSGGLHWGRGDTVGDIVCTDKKHSKYFRFAIECKFYKEIKFEHLINGNSNIDIIKFWEQAERDGKSGDKVPMVFMRYNGMKKNHNFVILSSDYFKVIENHIPNEYGRLEVIKGNHKLVIFHSEDLLNSEYKPIHNKTRKFLKQR